MTNKSLTLAVATAALASLSATAQIIAYDNTTGYQGQFSNRGNTEVGDEITLSTGASVLTDFAFEYNYTTGGDGLATGVLRLWDKAGNIPGSLLFQSQPFTLQAGLHSASVNGLSLPVPGTLVWTVDFDGIDAGEAAGLLFYNGTSQSLDDYWENQGTVGVPNWVLQDTATLVDNFGARVTVVPEPTTVGLLIGGAAVLGLAARRRKA
jgi:hypothetical protein